MTRDPGMPLADVQWVLGHAQLATTQLYMSAPADEVIAGVLAYHARMAAGTGRSPGAEPPPGLRYRPESLEVRRKLEGLRDTGIAAELRGLGLRTARGHEFATRDVRNVRHTIGLAHPSPVDAGELTVSQVAARLGVKPSAVYYWLRTGDLPYRKRPTGAVCIPFSTEIEAALRARPAVSRHVNRTQKQATGGAV